MIAPKLNAIPGSKRAIRNLVLNAKKSELILLEEQVDRLKADNERFQKTIPKINSQYYHLVDKLGDFHNSYLL